jgi:hypothetical protein
LVLTRFHVTTPLGAKLHKVTFNVSQESGNEPSHSKA